MTDDEEMRIRKNFEHYFTLESTSERLAFYDVVEGKIVTRDTVKLNRDNTLSHLPVSFKQTGAFDCTHNKLQSLEGSPEIVNGYFYCATNSLENLRNGPKIVYGDYVCTHNPFISLEGIPRIVTGDFFLTYNLGIPLLPLLNILSVKQILFFHASRGYTDIRLGDILSKYRSTGTRGMIACAEEMIEAGYGSNARYD